MVKHLALKSLVLMCCAWLHLLHLWNISVQISVWPVTVSIFASEHHEHKDFQLCIGRAKPKIGEEKFEARHKENDQRLRSSGKPGTKRLVFFWVSSWN